jgi:hypothetical protein
MRIRDRGEPLPALELSGFVLRRFPLDVPFLELLVQSAG